MPAVESFRPQRWRVIAVTLVGVSMGLSGLLLDAPIYIRVMAPVFLVMALAFPLVLRTEITVSSDAVRVRKIRGVLEFVPGHASVRITDAPTGLLSTAPVVTISRTSGGTQKVSVVLVGFTRRDRERLPVVLRGALHKH